MHSRATGQKNNEIWDKKSILQPIEKVEMSSIIEFKIFLKNYLQVIKIVVYLHSVLKRPLKRIVHDLKIKSNEQKNVSTIEKKKKK